MRMRFAVIVLVGAMVLATACMEPAQADEAVGNQVFFRGGWAGMTSDRSGEVFTDVFGATKRNDGKDGYYMGGGLDLVLSKDVWGMMSKTWALGEIGVEFKRFNSNAVTVAVPTTCAVAFWGATGGTGPCAVTTNTVQITMSS